MELVYYPEKTSWPALLERPVLDPFSLEKKIRKILDKVRVGGDKAVKKFTREFDGVSVRNLLVSEKEWKKAPALLDADLRTAITTAAANIRRFHASQLSREEPIETMPGIRCWRKPVAIEKIGLYIPGGTAPLFSTVLMLAIPAQLAGCNEIVLCTPPAGDGSVHPAILFAASLAGITRVIKAGGAQAIAAMAFGTESIPKVYKIFGPGNQYVNAAKQLVQRNGTAIDMPAGPSEVCVLADQTADPVFVAADLLSQAEHGADSQVLLVTDSRDLLDAVALELDRQLAALPRREQATRSLEKSRAILLPTLEEAMEFANQYAAEHLILACTNAEEMAEVVRNAGSVFLGHYSPESVGDYASGTNHTLPTNGSARAYSGVSVDSFVKKITYQQLTEDGLKAIAGTVEIMATAEGLQAHAEAVRVRLEKINVKNSSAPL